MSDHWSHARTCMDMYSSPYIWYSSVKAYLAETSWHDCFISSTIPNVTYLMREKPTFHGIPISEVILGFPMFHSIVFWNMLSNVTSAIFCCYPITMVTIHIQWMNTLPINISLFIIPIDLYLKVIHTNVNTILGQFWNIVFVRSIYSHFFWQAVPYWVHKWLVNLCTWIEYKMRWSKNVNRQAVWQVFDGGTMFSSMIKL